MALIWLTYQTEKENLHSIFVSAYTMYSIHVKPGSMAHGLDREFELDSDLVHDETFEQ